MLLALLFLFFCLSLGAVVLTAASVSAGRTAREQKDQQAYLSVASAARLLREDLADLTFTGSYFQIDTTIVTVTPLPDIPEGEEPSYEVTTDTYTDYSPGPVSLTGSRLLEGKSGDFAPIYYQSVPTLGDFVPAPLHYTLIYQADGMPDVTAELTIAPASDPSSGQAAYTITASLRAEGDSPYPITLVFLPQRSSEQISAGIPTTTQEGDTTTTIRTSTRSTMVTWMEPAITKGVGT